jgi:hypothetical protein
MDALLDTVWMNIVIAVQRAASMLDNLLAPLNALSPLLSILTIVLATVTVTKLLSRVYQTRRYQELKQEFQHWYGLRQVALQCEDREKAKALTRNIDQAKLNKVYYDYFFEGLLNNIVTKYLPILIAMAYVNEAYSPSRMQALLGNSHVVQFSFLGGSPVALGGLATFVFTLVLTYLTCWFIGRRMASLRSKCYGQAAVAKQA